MNLGTIWLRTLSTKIVVSLFFVASISNVSFAEDSVPSEVADLMERITAVNLDIPQKDQEPHYEKLLSETEAYLKKHNGQAEAWVVVALARASYARTQGMGALGDLKKVRKELEKAMKLDEQVMQGYAHSFLGRLYFLAPVWPLSYGSNKKAKKYLEQAMAIDDKLMANRYAYGFFLMDRKKIDEAKLHLEQAKSSSPLIARERWEENMQKQIDELLVNIDEKLEN